MVDEEGYVKEHEGRRASWQGDFHYIRGDKNITVKGKGGKGGKYIPAVKIWKLWKAPLLARENVYHRDMKAGLLAVEETVDIITRRPTKGTTTRIYVNERGEEVQKSDIKTFTKGEEGEQEVSPFEKTDCVEFELELPHGQDQDLLPIEYYEVEANIEEAAKLLYEIAKDLADNKTAVGGTMSLRQGWVQVGVVLVPKFDDTGAWALLVKSVADRIEPAKMNPIPLEVALILPTTKAPTLRVDPFAKIKKKK